MSNMSGFTSQLKFDFSTKSASRMGLDSRLGQSQSRLGNMHYGGIIPNSRPSTREQATRPTTREKSPKGLAKGNSIKNLNRCESARSNLLYLSNNLPSNHTSTDLLVKSQDD